MEYIIALGASVAEPHDTYTYNSTADDGHHEVSSSLFGSLSHIDVIDGTLSILIIVVAVLMVEKVFHGLHAITHDTPFADMVSAIEKELMIVGCMAFIFKIIVNTTHFLNEKWLHALEYADLVIPIVSFCFCGQGVVLILVSIRQCSLWSRAYHLHLEEILDEYYLIKKKTWIIQFIQSFIIQAEMEFRIYYEIFCDQYKFQRGSFAFDSYVELVYEKFLLEIVTIRPLDWLTVCVLALLNWGRNQLHLEYGTCAEYDTECIDFNAVYLFTILGAIMFGLTVFLALISRLYEKRLLGTRGVNCLADCPVFLRYCEAKPVESVLKKRIDAEELKEMMMHAKAKGEILRKHGYGDEMFVRRGFLRTWMRYLQRTLLCQRIGSDDSSNLSTFSIKSVDSGVISNNAENSPMPAAASVNAGINRDSRYFSQKGHHIITAVSGFLAKRFKKEIGSDVQKTFLFSNPEAYFEATMVQVMIISFYLALWITNYGPLAMHLPNHSLWVVISGLPGLLSFLMYAYIVKCAAILKAVTCLDQDAIMEVIEQSEASKSLSHIVQTKILEKLRDKGEDPEAQIKLLFAEIDENGSNTLSRQEFQIFLHGLEITFSRKRWELIFKEIDRNFDDEISLEELFLFIFPDHNAALKRENDRLRIIRARVRRNSTMDPIVQATFQSSLFKSHKDRLRAMNVDILDELDEKDQGASPEDRPSRRAGFDRLQSDFADADPKDARVRFRDPLAMDTSESVHSSHSPSVYQLSDSDSAKADSHSPSNRKVLAPLKAVPQSSWRNGFSRVAPDPASTVIFADLNDDIVADEINGQDKDDVSSDQTSVKPL